MIVHSEQQPQAEVLRVWAQHVAEERTGNFDALLAASGPMVGVVDDEHRLDALVLEDSTQAFEATLH